MDISSTASDRAAFTDAVHRDVCCERCGCAYRYELVRRVEHAPFWPFARATTAERRALAALQKELHAGVEPVPCPDCGWFQKPMVLEHRRRRLRWMNLIGWCSVTLGVAIVLLTTLITTHVFKRPLQEMDRPFLFTVGRLTAASALVTFGGRFLLIRIGQLNAGFPERRVRVPGAPRGFKPGEPEPEPIEPISADSSTLSYERRAPGSPRDGWFTVQLLGLQFPPICATCLEPTQATEPHGSAPTGPISVPACPACQRVRRIAHVKWSLPLGLVTAAAITFWPLFDGPPGISWRMAGTLIAIGIWGFGMGCVVGHAIAERRHSPVRFRRFSSTRNTADVCFKNPAYAAAFAEMNGLS